MRAYNKLEMQIMSAYNILEMQVMWSLDRLVAVPHDAAPAEQSCRAPAVWHKIEGAIEVTQPGEICGCKPTRFMQHLCPAIAMSLANFISGKLTKAAW